MYCLRLAITPRTFANTKRLLAHFLRAAVDIVKMNSNILPHENPTETQLPDNQNSVQASEVNMFTEQQFPLLDDDIDLLNNIPINNVPPISASPISILPPIPGLPRILVDLQVLGTNGVEGFGASNQQNDVVRVALGRSVLPSPLGSAAGSRPPAVLESPEADRRTFVGPDWRPEAAHAPSFQFNAFAPALPGSALPGPAPSQAASTCGCRA